MTDDSTLSKRRQWLATSALVPIVGALSEPTTLQAMIYTFFVCAYLGPIVFKRKKENGIGEGDEESLTARLSGKGDESDLTHGTVNFVLAIVGAGLVSECLAWLSQFFAGTNNPFLMHPQLFPDLFLGLFFYSGVAIAWLLLLKKFQYALKDVFFVSFLVALAEQAKAGGLYAICERLVSDPSAGLLCLASLFVVGGSVAALGFIAGHKIAPTDKKPALRKLLTKYAISFIVVALLPNLALLAGGFATRPLGLAPEKRPVLDAPLI